MTPLEVLEVARVATLALLLASLPLLVVSLVVGLAVSIIQALTQIQEVTLTFIPKIIIVFASLLIFLPFMGEQLGALFQFLIDKIIALQ